MGYTALNANSVRAFGLAQLPATQAQRAGLAAFQPRFHVKFQPVSRQLQRDGDREIVCGLVVIHKTPVNDPKIVLRPRDTGAAVRRIKPLACDAAPILTAK